MTEFLWPVRIYYEDTDSGGVVYYANYLKYLERARTEWLRAQGTEQDELKSGQGVLFAVRSLNVDYLKPAVFNDELVVSVRPAETGAASIVFEQEVRRGDELLCRAKVKIACIDSETLKPKKIPASVKGGWS